MATVAMTMAAVSCSSGSDSVGGPSQPDNSALGKDYQIVPVSGGTIEEGDLAITFPDGTFAADAQVAVEEVEQGAVLGDDEASAFYRVSMPVGTAKELTFKVACAEEADDIYLVTSAALPSMHQPGVTMEMPLSYDAVYAGGAYTATLPASANGNATDEVTFTVGLAHRCRFSSSADIASGAKKQPTRSVEGEQEGNITWYYETSRYFDQQHAAVLATTVDELNGYVHEAIRKIDSLGFRLNQPKRRIPITLFKETKENAELWGEFKQHHFDDESSWLAIKETMLTDLTVSRLDIRATLIHELLHYFQADYDLRIPWQKATSCSGDELLMYEAGGQWIEKFVNGGRIPCDTQMKMRLKHFVKGLSNVAELYKDIDVARDKNGNFSIGHAHQSHGYAMASLWEYLAQDADVGDKKIVELYDIWGSNASGWGLKSNITTFECIRTFVDRKRLGLLTGGYSVFINECAAGNIVPGFTLDDFDVPIQTLTAATPSVTINARCFAYGCDTHKLHLSYNAPLKGKKLVVKQLNSDCRTDIYHDGSLVRKESYTTADSLVISGDELEKLRTSYGVVFYDLLLVTFTNSMNPNKPEEYSIKCEIQDAEQPTDLKIKKLTKIYMDCSFKVKSVSGDYSGTDRDYFLYSYWWESAEEVPVVTQTGDRVHIEIGTEGETDWGDGSGTKSKMTLAFDIAGFSGDLSKCRLENFAYTNDHAFYYPKDDDATALHKNGSFSLSSVVLSEWQQYKPVSTVDMVFSGKAGTGYVVKDYKFTERWSYKSEPDKTFEHTPIGHEDDYVRLSLSFEY